MPSPTSHQIDRRLLPKPKPDVKIIWTSRAMSPLRWGTEGVYNFDFRYGYEDFGVPPRDLGPKGAVFTGVEGEEIIFEVETSFEETGRFPVEYEWSFGDGAEGHGKSFAHTYKAPSEEGLQVVVTVTDNKGSKWRARKAIYISEGDNQPMMISDGELLVLT